jgi:hypothetical protein
MMIVCLELVEFRHQALEIMMDTSVNVQVSFSTQQIVEDTTSVTVI